MVGVQALGCSRAFVSTARSRALQDMNYFYAQYKMIKPWLQRKGMTEEDYGKKANLQSVEDRAKLVVVGGSARRDARRALLGSGICGCLATSRVCLELVTHCARRSR